MRLVALLCAVCLAGGALMPARAADPVIPKDFICVALDDCGVPGKAPHYVPQGTGGDFTWPTPDGMTPPEDPRFASILHGNPTIQFRYAGIRPTARYFLRVGYYNPHADRGVRLDANGVELHGPLTPTKDPLTRTFLLPPWLYRHGVLNLTFTKVTGDNATVSLVELWSDQDGFIGPEGSYVRFRVDALHAGMTPVSISANTGNHTFNLTPGGITAPGYTPWINLRATPCKAEGLLTLNVPAGARGATQFSLFQDEQARVREIDWREPDGTRVFLSPGFEDIATPRDKERRYYLATAGLAHDHLFPLTRPPLLFANAWGKVGGGAAEYMVKTFRLLGLNCVSTDENLEKYARLYGWGTQGAQYAPPLKLPLDPEKTRAEYADFYRTYFRDGEGKQRFNSPSMVAFQLADEPLQFGLMGPDVNPAFTRWLAGQGVTPEVFGKRQWSEVTYTLTPPANAEEQRRYYWSRRYAGMITPLMFGLAGEGLAQAAPGTGIKSFAALSGHEFYLRRNAMPLDMFQLAQYPHVMPGISDWMVEAPGGWFWDSHQSVAFSVAAFNGGARRYGADFGKPPISFPMMHCVNPSLFRAYTQLANQCKLISFYNYGPDYLGLEGAWSGSDWPRYTVHHLCNQASLADDILGPGSMRPSRVALLYAMSTEYRTPQVSFADKRATFLALSHDYYQPELVNEDQVAAGALAQYDALYVLDPWVTTAAQSAIARWVKDGGLLWASADALTRNEYNEPSDLLQHLGVTRAFDTPAAGTALTVTPIAAHKVFNPHTVPAQGRPSAVTCPGARVWAWYGDEVPAWLESSVDKGKLVYVGHRAGLDYRAGAGKYKDECIWPDDRRAVINGPLFDARIPREMTISEPMVLAMPLSTEAGTVIPIYNMHKSWPYPRTNLVFTLREPKAPVSVQWVLAGELKLADLPFTFADGLMTVTLPDLPFDGTMLVIRRTPPPPDDRLERMHLATEAQLASTDWQTLSAGAWCAGFFPAWRLGTKLIPLLAHEHWAVRRSAAESLGRLGDTAAAGALRAAIENETDPHVLVDEIAALVRLHHPDAAALVRALREHPDTFRRAEGARLNGLLATPR